MQNYVFWKYGRCANCKMPLENLLSKRVKTPIKILSQCSQKTRKNVDFLPILCYSDGIVNLEKQYLKILQKGTFRGAIIVIGTSGGVSP